MSPIKGTLSSTTIIAGSGRISVQLANALGAEYLIDAGWNLDGKTGDLVDLVRAIEAGPVIVELQHGEDWTAKFSSVATGGV